MKIFKAVITSAAALLLASCGASPETRAESFMRALHAGHAGEAVEHLDPSVRQVGGPKLLAAMRQGHKKSQKMGGLAEAEAVESEVDGERATVTIRQTFHDSSEDTVTVKMRRVDGDWFVTF